MTANKDDMLVVGDPLAQMLVQSAKNQIYINRLIYIYNHICICMALNIKAIEIFDKADTYYILIVPSKMQMFNCMPTLHHLVDIILKQEVLNIANIVNFVPQAFINKNQSTDQ
jgi:hypothetical protein